MASSNCDDCVMRSGPFARQLNTAHEVREAFGADCKHDGSMLVASRFCRHVGLDGAGANLS
jgi:hypothetical protein